MISVLIWFHDRDLILDQAFEPNQITSNSVWFLYWFDSTLKTWFQIKHLNQIKSLQIPVWFRYWSDSTLKTWSIIWYLISHQVHIKFVTWSSTNQIRQLIWDQVQIKFVICFEIKYKSNSSFDLRSSTNHIRHLFWDQAQIKSVQNTVWTRVVKSGVTTSPSRSNVPRTTSHLLNSCDDQWVVLLYTKSESTDRSRVKNPF